MSADARVLLIDDSSTIRGLLSRLINGQAGMQVVGTAANGRLGVEQVRALDPDLVVLDIEMPVMTGLEALAEIRKSHPRTPVIMFSTLTEKGAEATLTALELGASAYATKPQSSGSMITALEEVKDDLVAKIRALVRATARTTPAAPGGRGRAGLAAPGRPANAGEAAAAPAATGPGAVVTRKQSSTGRVYAVVVGSSTGGPNAVEKFLLGIVRPLPVPIFLTQHMPPTFTSVLAKRLDTKVSTTVVEGADGMVAKPGHCYIAPGGMHMRIEPQGTSTVLVVEDGPMINSCKPSVEPLFSSAATMFGPSLLAVMLTGMGSDGVDGTAEIAKNGSAVIAQDEETSVVWGMPGAVAKAGLASEILPIDEIGPRVSMLAGSTATRPATRNSAATTRRAGVMS